MVYINSSGTTEPFTGAYNKRLEQNRFKAAAEAQRAERKETGTMTAREMLGTSVEISEESKEFMAGVAERKAAQIAEREAAREAARATEGGNAFIGTGDFKQQYLVLSENLYNNGFYDKLSDGEVRDMEQMLKDITSGMESINGSGLNRNFATEMSHEAAKLELVSSVNALNYFADKYVPEEMRDSFKEMIKQYESYNSKKVAAHKSIYDLRDESMAKLPAPNAVNAADKKTQEDIKASVEIGRVKHTKEEEQKNKEKYQILFDSLMQKQDSVSNIFSSLQNTLVGYASGGSKNSNVLAMLNSRNLAAIHNMSHYWSRLLG